MTCNDGVTQEKTLPMDTEANHVRPGCHLSGAGLTYCGHTGSAGSGRAGSRGAGSEGTGRGLTAPQPPPGT